MSQLAPRDVAASLCRELRPVGEREKVRSGTPLQLIECAYRIAGGVALISAPFAVSVRPIFGHKSRRLRPRQFDQRSLEPLVTQVSVFGHYDLKPWHFFLRKATEQFEKATDCFEVGVGFGCLDRTVSGLIDRLRREIDLGRLVD